MAIKTIAKTIDGVRYDFFNVQDIMSCGFFIITRSVSSSEPEKIDLFISKKINNWRNIAVEVVRIHLISFGEFIKTLAQDVYNRLSSFLINTLIECNYENYYQSIKILDIASKTNNRSIVFCYNNDKPIVLKLKKDW